MRNKVGVFLAMAVALFLVTPALAQQPADHQTTTPPLVQLLQSKGILTAQEAATISQASTADEANVRLAQLLVSKGLISQQDYNNTVSATAPGGAQLVNAVATAPKKSFFSFVKEDPDAVPQDAGVIPAVAPVQTLPIDLPKDPKGLIPDIKLGSGAMLSPYGFIKATAIYDSTNSGGATFGNNDFPLPLLLGDTGPDGGSQVHFKTRSTRIGTNFYWPSSKWDLIITGKVEGDFEGDFTAVNNRNVSSVRSSQFSIRHAWVRADTHLGGLPVFAEFGQDWTLLGSSTMPDILETTQLMAFFGNMYERLPQIKAGVQFQAGELKIQPEVAVLLAAFGDANLANTTPFCTIALSAPGACTANLPFVPANSVSQQLNTRFGARIGSDSGQPAVEGRIVFRYPLFHSPGVAPAQLVFSAHHANGSEIVLHGQLAAAQSQTGVELPGLTGCEKPDPVTGLCTVAQFFPTGFRFDIPQNIWTAEFQLPTPWVTAVGKYFHGGDTRFFFGNLNTTFADTMGLGVIANTIADSGDNIPFVNVAGSAEFAKLKPVRDQGGFLQLSFPLSRIFHADPEGHNAGWTLSLTGGVDSTKGEDVRRNGANDLLRTNYFASTLRYKVNKWMQIQNETTWYNTRCGLVVNGAGDQVCTAAKLFRGVDATNAHDWRNEFGTVITF
jgi:hypothetical protein